MPLPVEVTTSTETKPGIYTTEFWFTLFCNLLGTYELFFGGLDVDNSVVAISLVVLDAAYGISRGIAKNRSPYVPEVVEAELERRHVEDDVEV